MNIVCDIDSTVNDHWNRILRCSNSGVIDEKKAFSAVEVMKDKVLPNALEVNHKAVRLYHCNWVFLTARGWKDAYSITDSWLFKKEFLYHDLIICKNMSSKIEILKNMNCDIYIDDFTSGQERGLSNLTFRKDIKDAIENLGINVLVAKNNWLDILKIIQKSVSK